MANYRVKLMALGAADIFRTTPKSLALQLMRGR